MLLFRHADEAEWQRAIEQWRGESARLRRQIDHRLMRALRETDRLRSWRAYVERFPLPSAALAAGLGLAVAAGFRQGRFVRWLGWQIIQAAAAPLRAGLARELQQFWRDSAPRADSSRRPS